MSVPLCLRGRFTVTSANGNEYTTNITDIVPQRYSSPAGEKLYTGLNVESRMFASTNSDGRIFRIKSVGTRTETSLTGAILEDINGLNKLFDSSGKQAGNPDSGGGYIFQVNSEGLPMLTNIGDPLSPQFTDSLMGRFLYSKPPAITENFCVLTGSGNNTLAVTYDGKNFIGLGKSVFTTAAYGACYNGRMWVAVGEGGTAIATSTDGLNWTARASSLTRGRSVAWNGSVWVAVGTGTATIVSSTDGITWTSPNPVKPITTEGYSVIWDGTKFLAGGIGTTSTANNNTTGKLVQSFNGTSWKEITFTSLERIFTLATNGVIWLAGGVQFTTGDTYHTLFYSTNGGFTWTNTTSGYPSETVPVGTLTVTFQRRGYILGAGPKSIVWNGSSWLAVGDGTSSDDFARSFTVINGATNYTIGTAVTKRSIASSVDGINWVGQLNNYFPPSGANGVAWNGNRWIVCGGEADAISIITSTDGTNWAIDDSKLIFSGGRGIAPRRSPFLQTQPSSTISAQLYVQGGSKNNRSIRQIILNGSTLKSSTNVDDSTQRGVYLTILNGSDFTFVSETQYLGPPAVPPNISYDSKKLGQDLLNVTSTQIGILTSFREWEANMLTNELIVAARWLGLTKLASFTNDTSAVGRSYAAIFQGGAKTPTATPAYAGVSTRNVVERMESNDAAAPPATISAILVTNGTNPSIVGANSVSALYSPESNLLEPAVLVDRNRYMQVRGTNDLSKIILGPAPSTTNLDYCSSIQSTSVINSHYGSRLGFSTHDIASNFGDPVERMIINSSGQVQIGNTTQTPIATHLTLNNPLQALGGITANPITSQLAVVGESQRLYIGSYRTGGQLACSALQSSEYYFNRDNPQTLCLNPTGGQVNIGYGLRNTGQNNNPEVPRFDVNGYMRGKGTIVNTLLYKDIAAAKDWASLVGQAASTFFPYQYYPVQAGSVPIMIHAGVELTFYNGSGFDAIGWEVNAEVQATCTSVQSFGNMNYVMLSTVPADIKVGDTINLNNCPVAANRGVYTITGVVENQQSLFLTPGSTTRPTFPTGLTVNRSTAFTNILSTSFLAPVTPVGKLQTFNQQYLDNNLVGRTAGASQLLSGGRTSFYRISAPTLFSLRAFRSSGDDGLIYRNAYMIIHEISNS